MSQMQMVQLAELSIRPRRSLVVGQLKLDMHIPQLSAVHIQQLRQDMGFSYVQATTRFLVGVSTWPGEEQALLTVMRDLCAAGVDVRLILIRRHAERGAEVVADAEAMGFACSQHSLKDASQSNVLVHVADTMGEMPQLCQCAHLALVGKSFAPHEGGQTPLELAACGVPMVYGPNMSNFQEVCQELEQQGLSVKCQSLDVARSVIQNLLMDEPALASTAERLRAWSASQRGVITAVLQEFEQFLTSCA